MWYRISVTVMVCYIVVTFVYSRDVERVPVGDVQPGARAGVGRLTMHTYLYTRSDVHFSIFLL